MLRRVSMYLLFWLTGCLVFAQPQSVNRPLTAKIDSLQRLLANPSTVDTLRVIRLHALARLCFVDLQFKRGLLAAKEAQTVARRLRYGNGEGLYQQTLADFSYTNSLWYYYDFHFGLAAGMHQQAPPFNSDSSSGLGHPLSLDYTAINRQLATALTYFTALQDAEMMALILNGLSATYRSLHEVDKSLAYLDRSIQAFQQANQPAASYYLLAYKTRLLQEPNRLVEADRAERLVNQFLITHGNSRETAPVAYQLGWYYVTRNQLVRSFEVSSTLNAALDQLGDERLRPFVLENLGYVYITLKSPEKALDYFKKAVHLLEKTTNQSRLAWMYNKIAFTLIALQRFGEADEYIRKAKRVNNAKPGSWQPRVDSAQYYDATGQRLMGLGRYQQALPNFFEALRIDGTPGGDDLAFYFNFYIAQCYQKLGNVPASIAYGTKSYRKAILDNSVDGREITLKSSQLLFENYERLNQPIAAYAYLKTYYTFRQAVDEQNEVSRLAEMEIHALIRKGEQDVARLEQARLLKEQENQNQRWWLLSSAIALVLACTLLGLLYRSNRQTQQANSALIRQQQEIERQRAKADQALLDLKVTQNQLIQQEKLASLGELTAGIAHEIQNPLNFVNNYSIVSTKLVDELEEELEKGDTAGVKDSASTLRKNLHKIHHHGDRAAAIVRGMLEHSRTNSGKKRPVDLNKLANEYLQLAYHGLRARDVNFTCALITEFDATLGQVDLIPQEIGRVLLNLFNNASYAVSQRQQQTGSSYQPTLTVTTLKTQEGVQIRIADNGMGMSESVQQKIFQPFFTTKPTGEGTGLGLSLSHDIITKGHGGSLEVESREGAGSVFTICLPQIKS